MKYINKFCSLILTLIFVSTSTINSKEEIPPLINKRKLTLMNSQTTLLKDKYLDNSQVQTYNSFCYIVSAVSHVSNRKGNNISYMYCQTFDDLKNFIMKYVDSEIFRNEKEKLKISKSILDQILKSVSDLEKNKIMENNLYVREQNDICEIDVRIFDIEKTLFDNTPDLKVMNDFDKLINRLNNSLYLFSACFDKKSKQELRIKEIQQNLKYIQITINNIDKVLISSKLHQILCNLRAIYKEININTLDELVLFTKSKILKLISFIVDSFSGSPISKQEVIKHVNEIHKLFNLKLINY